MKIKQLKKKEKEKLHEMNQFIKKKVTLTQRHEGTKFHKEKIKQNLIQHKKRNDFFSINHFFDIINFGKLINILIFNNLKFTYIN